MNRTIILLTAFEANLLDIGFAIRLHVKNTKYNIFRFIFDDDESTYPVSFSIYTQFNGNSRFDVDADVGIWISDEDFSNKFSTAHLCWNTILSFICSCSISKKNWALMNYFQRLIQYRGYLSFWRKPYASMHSSDFHPWLLEIYSPRIIERS